MRTMMMAAVGAATLVSGCASLGGGGYGRDPYYAGNSPYYADQYYRTGANYNNQVLGRNDRVYVGRDGRYYCKRNDGTTGLIVGGIAGGALGAAIAPGGSGLLGALIGGAGGAALGEAVTKREVVCR